ncbi:hypothetical protein ABPG72_006706 [Tetrahymena utriculariae]
MKYQQNYYQEISKNVELSKYKQQSRLFDNIHFLTEQQNYNPLKQSDNYDYRYFQSDDDDEKKISQRSDSSVSSYHSSPRKRNTGGRRISRSRSRSRQSSSERNIRRPSKLQDNQIHDNERSSESDMDNQDENFKEKSDNHTGCQNEYQLINKQEDFIEVEDSNSAIKQQNLENTQLIDEEKQKTEFQKQKENSSMKKQNQEDILIEDLKQKINYYQFLKEQYLNISQCFKLQETDQITQNNQIQLETSDSQMLQENLLNDDDFKYKAIVFMNQVFNYSSRVNLEYQTKNIKCASGLEEGDQNYLISRQDQMYQFFSDQEIDGLNYFEFSERTMHMPDQFKNNLQQKLSNEKRLNFIKFILDRKVNKKLIESITKNELILDLMPSTIDTKVVSLHINIDNMLSILLAANCIASTFNFNLLVLSGNNDVKKQNMSNYQNYLQLLFDSIIQQRAVQSLSILNIPYFCKPLISSLQNNDLGFSYIQSLSINTYIGVQDQLNFLNLLTNLPYLSSLDCQGFILDTAEKVKAFNNLVRKLVSANIQIEYLPKNFNFVFQFENLKYLKIRLGIQYQQMTNRKIDNFFKSLSSSSKLKVLFVDFNLTMHKKEKKSKKNQQNRANQEQMYDSEEDIDEDEEEDYEQNENYGEQECQEYNEYEEEEDDDDDSSSQSDGDDNDEEEKGEEEVDNKQEEMLENDYNGVNNNQSLKLLNHLNNLTELKNLKLNLELSQTLAYNLLEFFQKNKFLKKFCLYSNEDFTINQYYQAFLQEFKQVQSDRIDFKNIFEIIACQQNLEYVDLSMSNYSIKYQKCNKDENSSKMSLQQSVLPAYPNAFNPIFFKLTNLIQLDYSANNDNLNCHELLNNLLLSLQTSENIQKINISINDSYNHYQSKQQYEQFPLFQNLNNLRCLNYLELNIKFDEIILNSLSELILTNKNIKIIQFQGQNNNTYQEQNLKGYGNLIRSLSSSLLQSASLNSLLYQTNNYFYSRFKQEEQEEMKQKHLKEIENEIVIPLIEFIENKNRKLKNLTFFQYLDRELHNELILLSLLKDIQPLKIEFCSSMISQFQQSQNLKNLFKQCQDKMVV